MNAVRKEPKKKSKKRFYTSLATAGLATAALLALADFKGKTVADIGTGAGFIVISPDPCLE